MADQREDVDATRDAPTIGRESSGTEPQTKSPSGAPLERVGGAIGPYKLLDELGEGGMGTVFLAEQDRPVRRRVALKIIKPGLDTAQVIARFEAERQALALMDHPNIARVVDAGTTESGRPYFVMELVQGVPITAYCDQRRLPLRDRLALFLPVCRAVQHAHQKGIIHRDLKPSNILVTQRDDQPVPKIIDFGIAKATTHRLTERTLYTQYGQLVGTPDYMSPEQAGMGGLDVDTRSDVYSLGAVLYELLCGDTPLGRERIKSLDFVTMLNVIYEHEPPPPSRRVAESADKAAHIARHRDTEPAKLTQQLRGELDWIATKALEKERTRRYESPSALAADIERHLNNQPVEASPHTATYRLKKFVRRNRAPLAAAAAIAIVLIGGIIASGWQAYRATQAEGEMAVEREAALQAKGRAEKLLGEVQAAKTVAETAKKQADKSRLELAAAYAQAKDAAEKEREARTEVERRLRQADAMRLAMKSSDVRPAKPQLAMLLAAEAVEATHRRKEPILPAANQALRGSLSAIGGRPLGAPQNVSLFLEHIHEGRWLYSGNGSSVWRWDLNSEDPAQTATPRLQRQSLFGQAISRDGRWLATTSAVDRRILVWDLQAEEVDQPYHGLVLLLPEHPRNVIFSPDARWLVATFQQGVWCWDISSQSPGPPVVFSATGIRNIGVSPDGKWLVSTDDSGANLWELKSGGSPRSRTLSPDWRSVTISADTRFVAAAPAKGDSLVWDLNADDPLQSPRAIPLATGKVSRNVILHFTPDNRYLAAAERGEIALWELAADNWQEPRHRLTFPESADGANPITALTSDRAGDSLLAARNDGTIYRWLLRASEDLQASRAILGRQPGTGSVRLNVSNSGRWLVTDRQNDHPRLWDLWNQSRAATGVVLRGHDSRVLRIAFGGSSGPGSKSESSNELSRPAASERWLVTSDLGRPRLWDLTARDPAGAGLRNGTVSFDGLHAAVRPDGSWIITNQAGDVQVVNPDAGQPIWGTISVGANSPDAWSREDAPLSRDGRWLARRDADNIAVFDLRDNQGQKSSKAAAKIVKNTSKRFSRFTVSPDGRWLLTTNELNDLALWNLGGAGGQATPVALGRPIGNRLDTSFSPDGRWLATAGHAGVLFLSRPVLALWDLSSNPPRQIVLDLKPDAAPGGAVGFSGDGKWIMLARGSVQAWKLGDDGPIGEPTMLGYDPSGWFERLAISSDGTRAAAAPDQTIYLWDQNADAANRQRLLYGHQQAIVGLAFSPDGRHLASAGANGDIRLWNAAAEQPQSTMVVLRSDSESRNDAGTRLIFSPHGEWLAAASIDGVHFWQLNTAGLLDDAHQLAARALSADELEEHGLRVPDVLRGRLLREAARLSPDDIILLRRRIDLFACAGSFAEAIEDMRRLINVDSQNHWPQYQLLSLLAMAGDQEAYRRASQNMAAQFGNETQQIQILEQIAKGGLFWAESDNDWKKLAQFADQAVQLGTAKRHQFLPWFQGTKALAEYRLGNYEGALGWAEKVLSGPQNGAYYLVPANLVKALALAQLGKLKEAQGALDAAKQIHSRFGMPVEATNFFITTWHDWYMAEILFREAEALLGEKSVPATSAGARGANP